MSKGFPGGYQPLIAVLLNHDVHEALQEGTGAFAHGQIFQFHVLASCAALEVQIIILEDHLVAQYRSMGQYLSSYLKNTIDLQTLGIYELVDSRKG